MDKIANVTYGTSGRKITTCTVILESGQEVLGSVYSETIPQLDEKTKEAARKDAMHQLERSKYPFLDDLEEAYMSSWKKLMNDVEQRLKKDLKERGIKFNSPNQRKNWVKDHVQINQVNKVNQVYLYPDTDKAEMLFAYDEQVTIKETTKDIFVEFGGIIDLKAPFKGKTLADSLKDKGEDVKPEEDYKTN